MRIDLITLCMSGDNVFYGGHAWYDTVNSTELNSIRLDAEKYPPLIKDVAVVAVQITS